MTRSGAVANIKHARDVFLAEPTAAALLEGMPDPAIVINDRRQLLVANRAAQRMFPDARVDLDPSDAERMLGVRPGEAMECVHAAEGPSGCGSSEACRQCGAARAVERCLNSDTVTSEECLIQTRGMGALDIKVLATPLSINGERYVVAALRDISAEKRRLVLERVFFHDVLNTAAGLSGIADLLGGADGSLDAGLVEQLHDDMRRLSHQIVDEIRAQSEILAAESGELEVRLVGVPLAELVEDLAARHVHFAIRRGRRFRVNAQAKGNVYTDPQILRRVLANLLQNALEGTPPGGEVTLAVRREGDLLRFDIHNPAHVPDHIATQIFKRSFSTKAPGGRGVGTYSVKLLTERYLGGRVDFETDASKGTTFTVELPQPKAC